ncbi:MAG TPA: TonB-dependent receptor, partial [Thermoanaerobaculia bacterium]|nr:TonB-dependent receptor [Thermoanaerobaculia bacterium]
MAILLAALVLPPPLLAQTPDPDDPDRVVSETLVVSANAIDTVADEVGSSVTVIERVEIERRDQVTLAELLRLVPGVEVTAGGGPGKVTTARVRGSNGSGVLVLVDGVRLNDTTTGAVDFADVLVDGLERVEVLRGPQAMYGSEALAGVISILTRRPEGPLSLRGLAEAGSDALRRAGLGAGRGGAALDWSLDLWRYQTDGVSQASERAGNREDDPYRNHTASGRLGGRVAGEGRVELAVRAFAGDTALDGFFGDDPNARQERESLLSTLRWSQGLSRRWSQRVALESHRLDLLGSDPDDPFNRYDIRSESISVDAQADVGLRHGTLSWGLGGERRDGFNRDGFDQSVDLASAFVSDQWSRGDRWFATATVRGDHHSTFGDRASWRLTSAVRLAEAGPRLHLSYGTAFRAPSFNELYFPFAGDPELRPETSEGWDLGFAHESARGRVAFDLTWFRLDHDDLIDFDLARFVFANVAEARSEGVEGLVRVRARRGLELTAGHTWNRTRDPAANRPLPRRPEHRSTLAAGWRANERWHAGLTVLAVRDRIDSTGLAMEDYERVDLRVDWSASARWRPYLRITNLLDDESEEVTGFTTPGASLAVGARFAFRGR